MKERFNGINFIIINLGFVREYSIFIFFSLLHHFVASTTPQTVLAPETQPHIDSYTWSSTLWNSWECFESLLLGSCYIFLRVLHSSNLYVLRWDLLLAIKNSSIWLSPMTKLFQSDWNMKNTEEGKLVWLNYFPRNLGSSRSNVPCDYPLQSLWNQAAHSCYIFCKSLELYQYWLNMLPNETDDYFIHLWLQW